MQPSGVGAQWAWGTLGVLALGAFAGLYFWGRGFIKDSHYYPPWEALTSGHPL